ncbi:hypothetical protein FGRMN_520 [Fusarium graminum]|nr:hypothetical protein FGRMN_520 [Fusarium graminum]
MTNTTTVNGQGAKKYTETFWPLLRSALISGETTFSDLELECIICYNTMTLSPGQNDQDNDHRPVIYPCGHMFGHSCSVQNSALNNQLGKDPGCPACRGKFHYTCCGHPYSGLEMPRDMASVERFPPIVPHGGLLFDLCLICLVTATLEVAWLTMCRADPRMPRSIHDDYVLSIIIDGKIYYSKDVSIDCVRVEPPEAFKQGLARLKDSLGCYEDGKAHWMPGQRLRDVEVMCHLLNE